MVFGDTRHTADQPFNVLSGAGKNGLFPRPADQLANLASYGDVFQNYCVETDPICAQGKVVNTHLNYFDVFTDEVAKWVKSRVEKAGGAAEGDSESSTTAAASTTKTKASTSKETTETVVTTMASETEATTMVVTKSKASETDAAVSSATVNPSAVVTSLVEAASSAGQAAAAASATTTDNAAAPTGAPLVGIMMGVAALLAI